MFGIPGEPRKLADVAYLDDFGEPKVSPVQILRIQMNNNLRRSCLPCTGRETAVLWEG